MHVILFDIDGTLLSSGGAGKAAMEGALITEFGLAEPLKRVPFSGRTDRSIGRDLLGLHGIEANQGNWERLLTAYLQRLPACLLQHRGQVLPGIAALLDHLRQREQMAMGLLTGNVRAGAQLKLGHYELDHHFAFGGFGDHHFERDDVAREALAAIPARYDGVIHSERIWVIGDTPLDISCARAIGARVAAVATGWHSFDELAAAQPDLLVPDFSDPSPLLELLK